MTSPDACRRRVTIASVFACIVGFIFLLAHMRKQNAMRYTNDLSVLETGYQEINTQTWTETLSISGEYNHKEDGYLCTYKKLPLYQQTVTKLIPTADMKDVHHMLLYACESPPQGVPFVDGESKVWNGLRYPPCSGKSEILYAWAKGAGPFELDGSSGMVVGEKVGLPYLVLQTHFLTINAEASGQLDIEFKKASPDNLVTMLLFMSPNFQLPPKQEETNVNVDCCISGSTWRKLYGYRVHAHDYSRNISLQIKGEDVVHGNPQMPHIFQKPDEPLLVTPDAHWKVTCSYDTQSTDRPVNVGEGHMNEMCNMYFMISSHVPLAGMCLDHNYLPSLQLSIQDDMSVQVKEVLDVPGLGQVGGLHLGYERQAHLLLIFHRAHRVMEGADHEAKIAEDVFIVWDTKANKVIKTFGKNMFNLPHGLTIDYNGDIWTTDVDNQQASMISSNGTLLKSVGIYLERGKDVNHLCRPTEVAVSKAGDFFVADGYCNNHVMHYDQNGKFLKEYKLDGAMIPHSVLLDECTDTLYVADRENGKIIVLSASTGIVRNKIDLKRYGLVYSITMDEYSNVFALIWKRQPLNGAHYSQVYFAQLHPEVPGNFKVIPLPQIVIPHDFAVTYNFEKHAYHVYVGETGPGPRGKITLFEIKL